MSTEGHPLVQTVGGRKHSASASVSRLRREVFYPTFKFKSSKCLRSAGGVQRLAESQWRAARPTESIFAHEPPRHSEEADWLFSHGCCLSYAFRNCLEDDFEPVWLDAAKDLAPEKKVPDGANCFRRFSIID
jgi:hypothetical protein